MLTALQFAQQIVAQARVLDPSFSGEVGTPERKIIDSVAQSLANNQIDLTGLGASLNINSKVGSNLDSFTGMFGMQRQQATSAAGFVVYTRNSPAPANISIPQGSLIQANNVGNRSTSIQFATVTAGVIPLGGTTSGPIPVQAVAAGTVANVAANTLTQMVGTPVPGVTAVTNPTAIINGLDSEDDNSFKTRFQNTWARNLAGTTSRYLGIALAGAFTTKATCIGQQSVYREYIQVPDCDDAGFRNGVPFAIGVDLQDTFGNAGQWTTALSDIPYAKQIFTTTPVFVSNDQLNPTYFYRPNVDFTFHYPPYLQGDALRDSHVTQGLELTTIAQGGPYSITSAPQTITVTSTAGFPPNGFLVDNTGHNIMSYNGITGTQFENVQSTTAFTINTGDQISYIQLLPATIIYVESVEGFPSNGTLVLGTGEPPAYQTVTYTGVDATNHSFTGCSGTGTGIITYFTQIYSLPVNPNVPNFTFNNIFNPVIDLSATGLQVLHPGDVVLSEYSYVSTASRNDLSRNINNAVDVYVDGANDVQASTVFLPNVGGGSAAGMFSDNPSSPYYVENFRRHGEPTRRPQIGNYLTPLYQAPLDGLPPQITVDGQIFYEGWHYWLVNEVGPLAGSIRSRDGIEWNVSLAGDTGSGPPVDPTTTQIFLTPPPGNIGVYIPIPASPVGNVVNFSQSSTLTPIEVNDYLYDANIVTIQAVTEQAKQITTDVLVHKAQLRYFKFYLTLQYAPQQNPAVVNAAVQTALQAYLANQYFGTVIQLTSVLETVAGVTGVQNVRWSNDLPIPPNQIRVVETDVDGVPLYGVSVERLSYGQTALHETQTLYISGNPDGLTNGIPDFFFLTWTDTTGTGGGTIPNTGNTFTVGIEFFDATTGLPVTAAAIQAAIQASASAAGATGTYSGITVTEDPRSTIGVTDPIRSFTIHYNANGTPVLPAVDNHVTASAFGFNKDFFLLDNQLPSLPNLATTGDTLPGLVVEVRAPNTWLRNAGSINSSIGLGA